MRRALGNDGPTPKPHYAVQLALYVDILERLGLSAGRRAYVWDIQGNEVPYDFTQLYGKREPRTLWDDYQTELAEARAILARTATTRPAYTSSCKLCHWRSHCLEAMEQSDDITLMAKLGRSLQDVISAQIPSMADMANIDPEDFIQGKKTVFAGVGPDRLRTFCERARMIKSENPAPRLTEAVTLPVSKLEIFFDVETDPMQDICYLHGFLERRDGDNESERFVSFFAEAVTREAEEAAFRAAWAHLSATPTRSSTTTQNTSARPTASCSSAIRRCARPTTSSGCSRRSGPWTCISMWLSAQRYGRRGTTPSRRSRSISGSPGAIRTHPAQPPSNGTSATARRAAQTSRRAYSTITRMIVGPLGSSWMACVP